MRSFIAFRRFLLLAMIWLALTGAEPGALATGIVAAMSGTWLSLRLLAPGQQGVSLIALARMFPGFVRRSALGGVDVAWRALHPRMPLKPGWISLATSLPEGGARVALGGELSLLPGTLVAGSQGDKLLVHCLDTDQQIESAFRREEGVIAASMDRQRRNSRLSDGEIA